MVEAEMSSRVMAERTESHSCNFSSSNERAVTNTTKYILSYPHCMYFYIDLISKNDIYN